MQAALQLLFEDVNSEDAKRWFSQSFTFHNDVLVQNRGGPCGVLACVQAHVILYEKFVSPQSTPQECLKLAVFEILQRAVLDKTRIVLAQRTNSGAQSPFTPDQQVSVTFVESINDAAFQQSEIFNETSPAAVMLFVLSLLWSKTLEQVKSDMDDSDATLTGRFGHCGQEMLNLILTGRGSSQLHDFEIAHDSGLTLHGVYARPRIGLLTQLETYRLVQVGSFLKNPEFPIWVIASESHFTVLYSEDRNCDAKSPAELVLENAKRMFHTKDVQDNGFVQQSAVAEIVTELFPAASMENVLQFVSSKLPQGDICLWTDFWQQVGPLLKENKPLDSVLEEEDGTWACAACTFANAKAAKQCEMCGGPAPPPPSTTAASAAKATTSDWSCPSCTMMNLAVLDHCMMCGTAHKSADEVPPQRTLTLYHVNGLQRTVQGETILPKRSPPILLTTVEPGLAFNGSSKAFEEVLQTKWTGAVFAYGDNNQAPSIVG